jgi:hypothetical protein
LFFLFTILSQNINIINFTIEYYFNLVQLHILYLANNIQLSTEHPHLVARPKLVTPALGSGQQKRCDTIRAVQHLQGYAHLLSKNQVYMC